MRTGLFFVMLFWFNAFAVEKLALPPTADIKVEFPVEKFVLKNGLTVLLHQDRSTPMVSYHTWYRVGSRDEQPGVTGAAHMLEHMMFKGAKKYSGKDFDRILHENGITNNAFTSYDYTGFYQNLPSSQLELMMDMEVDRMRYLNIAPEDLKSELQVVGEERRWRIENNPMSMLREMLHEDLFKVHPYRWPVIGWMDDIQAYTSEKLRKFYDEYYIPNNAVLVLAGDIDIPKTKKWVEKYYGALKAKPLGARQYPQEGAPQGPSQKTLKWNVQAPSVMVGFLGHEVGHPESWALDLAAAALGSGKSSRLYKRLVLQEQIATNVSAYNMTLADPGTAMVVAYLKPGGDIKRVERVILQEIEKFKKELLTNYDLQRLRNQILKDVVVGLKTIDNKAQSLALNEILFNDYTRLFSDVKKYNDVSANDIQKAAVKYFVPARRTTGVLVPNK
jgi:zinc protease